MSVPLVEAIGLTKHFRTEAGLFRDGGDVIHAVDDVSLVIRERETLALVGESGCGKSTLGRLLIRLLPPTEGQVRFEGEELPPFESRELRKRKRDMQIIFQDPYASLDPRMKVLDIVGEPLSTHLGLRGSAKAERVGDLLVTVGLNRAHMDRYPHMFSGGQRQRIGIARALALDPKFIVCDEPVSALDVSIQSQVINLLQDLQESKKLTYLFISHDLNVVRHISDRVCVMFLGKAVEYGSTREIYARPLHPYTMFLLQASPLPDPRARYNEKKVLQGEIPSPINPPSGCRFRTRCPLARPLCAEDEPLLKDETGLPSSREGAGGSRREVACHFPLY
jgi:oligopeptide/dipeptide ABC transporter ATP-binding protein